MCIIIMPAVDPPSRWNAIFIWSKADGSTDLESLHAFIPSERGES